jgi:hypothetical protein
MRANVFIESVAFDEKSIINRSYRDEDHHKQAFENQLKPAEKINNTRNDKQTNDPEMPALIRNIRLAHKSHGKE